MSLDGSLYCTSGFVYPFYFNIRKIFQNNDENSFHNFMGKYDSYEDIKEFWDPQIDFPLGPFNKFFNNFVAEANISCEQSSSIHLMKILINDYGFIPDEKFMTNIRNMEVDMLMLFHQLFDLSNYVHEVKYIFVRECHGGSSDKIKQILGIGYNINKLIGDEYFSSAIYKIVQFKRYHIMEYMLDSGFDLKIFEYNTLLHCVKKKDIKMLTILIKHGANMDVLNNNNIETKSVTELYNFLVSYNIDQPIILKLISLTDPDLPAMTV